MPRIHPALLTVLTIPGLSSLQFPNSFTLSYFTMGAPGGSATDDLIFTPYARLEHVLGDPRSALSLLCPWESQFSSGSCCLPLQAQLRAWVDNIQRSYGLVCKVTVLWASGLKFKCIRGMTRPDSLPDLLTPVETKQYWAGTMCREQDVLLQALDPTSNLVISSNSRSLRATSSPGNIYQHPIACWRPTSCSPQLFLTIQSLE